MLTRFIPSSAPTHSNAGGGGERVLWLAIHALASLHAKSTKQKQKPLHVLIYTGDLGVAPNEILRRAEAQFGVRLKNLSMPLSFVFVRDRHWLEAARYPVLTMVGQSLGSILLAFVCLITFLPDVFIDTTGCAFMYPVAALLGRCRIAAYVHYPTISTVRFLVVGEVRRGKGLCVMLLLMSCVSAVYIPFDRVRYFWMTF